MTHADTAGGYGSHSGDARRHRMVTLLATSERAGDGVSPRAGRTRLGRLCALAVSEIGVTGAGITVMGSLGGLAGDRDQVWATDPMGRRLESLQLTTGEGPCLDAFADGAPVLVGDLVAEPGRWVGFGPEAVSAGAAAVFSLPLQVGATRLGSLNMHRDTAGALNRQQLADGLVLAGLATEILLDLGDAGTNSVTETDTAAEPPADDLGWLPGVHAEVHQASGMVSARESIPVDAALLRIRGHAYAHGVPIERVAHRIVERTLTLDERRADERDVVPDDHPSDRPAEHPDDNPDGEPTGSAGDEEGNP